MKQKTIIYLIIFILPLFTLHAQVTIGNADPPHTGAVLELKSNNKGFLGPRIQLESISSPNPITNPAKGLLVFNIADSGIGDEQVKKECFYLWNGTEWDEFIYEEIVQGEITRIMDDAGIPRSAVFHLNGKDIIDNRNTSQPILGIYDAMKDRPLGSRQWLPFKETHNETKGNVTMETDALLNSSLRFKKGAYSITYAYQFIPATYAYPKSAIPVNTCTASSYFVDFPMERSGITGDRARIHNVAYHGTDRNSHHGGSISYVVKIEDDNFVWPLHLGAGQSGSNCNYNKDERNTNLAIPGFCLVNDNTFVLVSRIGD